MLSSLLGIYRDRLINGMYLDTYKVGADAYVAAFTVPDFMYFLLVSGALSVSFIPVNLVGVAISNAAFPRMTERLAEGRVDLFKKELRSVFRWIVWLALPIAVITFFARGYVVAFIKNGGQPAIASVLGALVISIFFRTLYHIMARTFYAQQDTRTPLYISIATISLNILLAIVFTQLFGWGVFGLAWAQSIVSVVEIAILLTILHVRTPGIFNRKTLRSIITMMCHSLPPPDIHISSAPATIPRL